MACTALLLLFLLVATYTDIRWRKIFNGTTYSGMAAALIGSAVATMLGVDVTHGGDNHAAWIGFVSLPHSLLGLFGCGALVLLCYLFFPQGMGGGDVKLLAMIGAFVGLWDGFEVLLWTLVIAGCSALIVLIWRVGAVKLCVKAVRYLLGLMRIGRVLELDDEDRQHLKTHLFLSPSALLGVMIVRFRWIDWFSA